ncbi:glycosyltransferase family 2 protein [Niabella sp. CC-SYL272]|uniref:glycosyltransferase family 2 protein n=1 Tax=Niabella agricola TaxID=2891571 RepID=UPI001F2D6222|nr:glycosyltransferase family 2 protein [Niabella agricola]MCF3110518.1 glycosyltransferase family 2 protein [Niabella agricola]
MTLSIIIVSYNVKYFLEHCLVSVLRAAKDLQTEIIVVDNCSTDGSLEYLLPLFPQVLFIANKENAGFGRACNQGLRSATGRFVLFLNPDTLVPENALIKSLEVFERDETVGAVGIRMFNGAGIFLKESKRGFPSCSASFFKLSGMHRFFPGSRTFDRYYMGHLDDEKDQYVEVLAGAFMLIPREVLEKTGSFDEAFFMYGEDIDLSYRIYKSGYKNYYLSDPAIIHFKGESTSKSSLGYIKNFYQAMGIFVNKHHRGTKRFGLRLLVHLGIWTHAALKYISGLIRPGKKKEPEDKGAVIVVGSEQSAAGLLRQFAEIGSTVTIIPSSEQQLVVLLKAHPHSPVYLCEQDMRFAELIRIVRQSQHRYLNFYNGNSIIAGS